MMSPFNLSNIVRYQPIWLLFSGILSCYINSAQAQSPQFSGLTLAQAVLAAQHNDPWLAGSRYQQQAIAAKQIAAGTLPDPTVALSLANVATNSFDFNQEAMSQWKISVAQMLPRGDSLTLDQQRWGKLGQQQPFRRQDRMATIEVEVTKLWLDTYLARQSIALIEGKRELFEQLADVAQASYASAIGKTRQQDIVRAQLELTRLEDRLVQLSQHQQMFNQQLAKWLSLQYVDQQQSNQIDDSISTLAQFAQLPISTELPNITLSDPQLFTQTMPITDQQLARYFVDHPAIKALDMKISASDSTIALAKQQYQPQWGVNASYGYRGDTPSGAERADLFSVGLSFDLPLFSENKQDQGVQAAIASTESIKTEKLLLMRQFSAGFAAAITQWRHLNQRQTLYQTRLLPQMLVQAEASLTAYTNNDGDFAEVVRARISELNAQIDALGIAVERQKVMAQLNYYLVGSDHNSINEQGSIQ